jgi:acyl-coenzyme A thioesterase PaaI-like protein
MRAVASDLVAEVGILRAGRTMVFAEVSLSDAEGRLAGHATATYMLLPRPGGGGSHRGGGR